MFLDMHCFMIGTESHLQFMKVNLVLQLNLNNKKPYYTDNEF